MKNRIQGIRFFISASIIIFLFFFQLNAQIKILSDEYPSTVGTFIITENNNVDSIIVDVGLPGENQTWVFDQEYPRELYRQFVVSI